MCDQKKYEKYIQLAEKNLSYKNNQADEIALKYFRLAIELRPTENELEEKIATLDKIVNYLNYNYPIDDKKTLDFVKLFVECCIERGFERLYDIIADDFVCISMYFGRTKNYFIDSLYYEKKSFYGLNAKIGKYLHKNRQIPCVILNNYGILFLNISNNKIVRIIEKKLGDSIDKDKLKEWNE